MVLCLVSDNRADFKDIKSAVSILENQPVTNLSVTILYLISMIDWVNVNHVLIVSKKIDNMFKLKLIHFT